MMILKWFNAREAADLGAALADEFAPLATSTRSGNTAGNKHRPDRLEELLQHVDRDVRSLRLNFYKRAKFANSFKWRLLENGVKPDVANEVTERLIVHLSRPVAVLQPGQPQSSALNRSDAAKTDGLLAQAHKSFTKGEFAKTVDLYNEFLELAPNRPDVLNDLGVALCRLGRFQEGEQRFREAIDIDPAFPEALCNIADLLQANPQEAEQWLRRALKINPKYPGARTKLGIVLTSAGRPREANTAFRKALKLSPTDTDALLGLANIARSDGRFDEAETLITRVLEISPKMPTAWAALQGARRMTSADSGWLKEAEEIAGSGISLWQESELRFAMGKFCDDVGDYPKAFENYRRGNELLKSVAPKYDRQAHSRFVDDMTRAYTRESLTAMGAAGSSSAKPIFVVGMPRSGTSLVEQIIASHPTAEGAGEPDYWLQAARAHQSEVRGGTLGDPVKRQLAEDYLRVLERLCPDATRIVDKTPTNSDYVGLLHCIFPNARIIRMVRNPIDTCLSCYFQHFSTGMTFTMDLADLADYYRTHQRVMRHWLRVLPPEAILEVPYEDLVADQEAWTRKILDFIGLEWDERCLAFHETERTVTTASAWQVRQKMYKQSVERWRNYEKFIGPLKGLRD
jgi:Flp pilus assembly protein TadD